MTTAREHLDEIKAALDASDDARLIAKVASGAVYALAREAECEATPPSAGDGDEFRHFVPYGSTSAPCGYKSGLDHRGKPLTDERRLTTCGACQDRMTGWTVGKRPAAVTPPPSPRDGDECAGEGGGRGQGQTDTTVAAGHATARRRATSVPGDNPRPTPPSSAPPAPVDEAAVEALARDVIDALDAAVWTDPASVLRFLGAVERLRGAVPGYGPTGASVGAGEVVVKRDDLRLVLPGGKDGLDQTTIAARDRLCSALDAS